MTQEIDWKNLGFGYMKTPYNVRCTWKDGQRGDLEVHEEETISLHMGATCLHYGQECFEGLKAFQQKDGRISIFRPEENAKRMARTAERLVMQSLPPDRFVAAIKKVVSLNTDFVPPYGFGASLYIRPLLIGSGPRIGVQPAAEYTFLVFVMPVGPYYKGGMQGIKGMICRDYDRAAPLGTGNYKAGGNYAASLIPQKEAKNMGYSVEIYLDAKEKKYIDECGTANFFGIKDTTFVTPKSDSILPSITNMSLQTLATEMGLAIEQRKIAVEELATFREVGACGTAAVITPLRAIFDPATQQTYDFGSEVGPISMQLYTTLLGMQTGDIPDMYGWNTFI